MQIRRVLAVDRRLRTRRRARCRWRRRTTTRISRSARRPSSRTSTCSVAMVDRVSPGADAGARRFHPDLGIESLHEGAGRPDLHSVHDDRGQDAGVEAGGVLRPRRAKRARPAVAPAPDPKDKDKQARARPRPIYPWERISFTQVPASGKMSRAIVLKPGDYDAYIAIKEKFDNGSEGPGQGSRRRRSAFLKRELSRCPTTTARRSSR